jgi:hypothetical protein
MIRLADHRRLSPRPFRRIPSGSRPGCGTTQQGIGSAWQILPALRWVAGPQLYGKLGTGRHRQTDDALALCQLRRLRGSRHPGQPSEGLWVGTGAGTTTGRASIHRMAARSENRYDSVSGSYAGIQAED